MTAYQIKSILIHQVQMIRGMQIFLRVGADFWQTFYDSAVLLGIYLLFGVWKFHTEDVNTQQNNFILLEKKDLSKERHDGRLRSSAGRAGDPCSGGPHCKSPWKKIIYKNPYGWVITVTQIETTQHI